MTSLSDARAIVEADKREQAKTRLAAARKAMLDAVREADKAELGTRDCAAAWGKVWELAAKVHWEAAWEMKRSQR